MEKAYDTTLKNVIEASKAKPGVYFCIECNEYSYLTQPEGKSPYFRHFRHNENCSLSVKTNSGYFNINSIVKILKSEYKERWIEAINALVKHDNLYILEGKNWALEPLNYYITKFYNQLDDFVFFQLLIFLMTIDNEKVDHLFYKYIFSSKIDEKDRKHLLKKVLKSSRPVTTEILNYILSENEIDHNTIFQVIYKKMGNFEYLKLLEIGKYTNLVNASILLKNFKKNYSQDELYLHYLKIKQDYFNIWNEETKLIFLNILINNIKQIKRNTDMEKLFEKDLLELKYYV